MSKAIAGVMTIISSGNFTVDLAGRLGLLVYGAQGITGKLFSPAHSQVLTITPDKYNMLMNNFIYLNGLLRLSG
jgi:hypothetical protein